MSIFGTPGIRDALYVGTGKKMSDYDCRCDPEEEEDLQELMSPAYRTVRTESTTIETVEPEGDTDCACDEDSDGAAGYASPRMVRRTVTRTQGESSSYRTPPDQRIPTPTVAPRRTRRDTDESFQFDQNICAALQLDSDEE